MNKYAWLVLCIYGWCCCSGAKMPQGPSSRQKEPPYSLDWVRNGRNERKIELSAGGDAGNEIITAVTNFGMNQTKFLKDIREPELFKQGMTLSNGHPGLYLAAFNKQKTRTQDLARYGYASLRASELLSRQFLLTRSQATFGLEQVDLQNTELYRGCPFKTEDSLKPSCPSYSFMYRTMDGTCNNFRNPQWGAAFKAFARFLPPDYSDGVESLRESVLREPLPNPRRISVIVHQSLERPSHQITQMIMQWGQFLDHDLTSTAMPRGFNHSVPRCCDEQTGLPLEHEFRHPDCLPIDIAKNDRFYSRWNHTCMEFLRSSPAPRPNCALGPRDQINQVTGYLDASNVYGSDDREMAQLRLWEMGMLNYKPIRFRKPLLPPLNEFVEGECRENSKNLHCFRAGDNRVNEHPGLASMHTLWLREHNRLVEGLSKINPHWKDDRLFFEARKIVGAQMQKITYGEWLPVVLGPSVMKIFRLPLLRRGFYRGYRATVNPTVTNSFGAAVFRFGHSLVPRSLSRCDKNGRKMPFSIRLHNELMNPSNIHNFGSVDRLLLGFINEQSPTRDVHITNELTRHLFQTPGHNHGMDLASINLQRGRDHGLPAYNVWREQCGLHRFKNWGELLRAVDDDTVGRLAVAYKHVDDIDLFTGGLAERPVIHGLLGPTFACILGQQFLNLRQGDRFWFENGGFVSAFTIEQLRELRKTTLARVYCDNLDDIDEIQRNVFRPLRPNGRNPKISCKDFDRIPAMNLSYWKEVLSDQSNHVDPSIHQFNYSKSSIHTTHVTSDEDYVTEESLADAKEEDLFYLEDEQDLQSFASGIRYSNELPVPFQQSDDKSPKDNTRHSSWADKAGLLSKPKSMPAENKWRPIVPKF